LECYNVCSPLLPLNQNPLKSRKSDYTDNPEGNFKRVDNSRIPPFDKEQIQTRWKWRYRVIELVRPRLFVILMVVVAIRPKLSMDTIWIVGVLAYIALGNLFVLLLGKCPGCKYPLYDLGDCFELGPASWLPLPGTNYWEKCPGCAIELNP
jgi:hypothetical protein